jgi:hypothetical protein
MAVPDGAILFAHGPRSSNRHVPSLFRKPFSWQKSGIHVKRGAWSSRSLLHRIVDAMCLLLESVCLHLESFCTSRHLPV